jgi:hypothetical protein
LKRLVEVEEELYTKEYYLIIELQQLRSWKKLAKQKKINSEQKLASSGSLIT